MAININKAYPSKLTLNLVIKEKKPVRAATFVPLLLVVAFFSVLFSKFAVINRLGLISEAEALENTAERRLEELMKYTAEYDSVLSEYNKYASGGGLSDTEQDYVDRMELLALIQTYFIDTAEVNSYSLTANILSIKLKAKDLTSLSELLSTLKALPMVNDVSLSNAGAVDKVAASVTMTLTLNKTADAGTTGASD